MIGTSSVVAIENIPTDADDIEIKSIEVPLEDVLDTYANNPSKTSILSKDFGTSTGQTGKIKSSGQSTNLTKVIPDDLKVAVSLFIVQLIQQSHD